MLKVLLVDDDILVRNKVRSMIQWEAYGFILGGEAVNGSDAVQMLEEIHPHIVMLDVSMPIMDGVELSSYINAKHKQIKMIVLSSYDHFDYVRETMKNGAMDYLLKHKLDASELIGVLEKAKSLIASEAQQKKEIEMASKKWDILSPAVSQKYIKEWVLGIGGNLLQITEYFKDFHFQLGMQNIIVVVMQLTNFSIITERYSNKDRSVLINSVTDLCNNIVYTLKNGSLAYMDQGRFVLLFAFQTIRSENNIFSQLQSYIDKIDSSISRFFNIVPIFGYSSICRNLEEIPRAYEKAVQMMEGQLFSPNKRVLHKPAGLTLSISQEKQLLSALEALDDKEVLKFADDLFCGMIQDGADYNSVQMIVSELIKIASKMAQSISADIQGSTYLDQLTREKLKQCKKLEDIKECILALFNNLLHELKKNRLNDINSRYIHEAVHFISQNYLKDISMEEVAKRVKLSPTYFSKLFKDEMAMTFPEYLNKVRIDAAKNHIQKGEKKAKTIYSKVGFNSYNYFIKVFKETTGFTPSAYALRKVEKEEN